ncbi:6989_t:CDS:2 [Acaulospora morrowiae]|nr:6989_t:CDS:2 [Acaulospora morrowiae]
MNQFEALRWNRIKKLELKSSITILLCVMCPLLLTYDVAVTYIKYTEGFLMIPINGEIITKPQDYWSDIHKQMAIPLDYVFCASFSVQTCLLFLLQSFWNYLANNIAKTTFMGSFEFKSYIVYSIFSFLLFPLLQWIFRENEIYTEAIPQLAYGAIMFVIALLGLRSNRRFSRLLRSSKNSNTSQVNIVAKLEYFKEMNQYLTCSLFIGSSSVVALSVDALTPARFLNTHKFTIDLLICHANFTIWVVFVTLILIFYPSTNSLSDLITGKGLASTVIVKSTKSNPEAPGGKRWSKYIPVSENSPWSSQVSTRNDRASWYLDIPDDMNGYPPTSTNGKNHNSSVYRSNGDSVTIDIFPSQSTSSHGIRSPRGALGDAPSSFYFASNALLPSPTYPPTTMNSGSVLKYPSSPVKNRNSLTSLSSLPPISPPPTISPPPIPITGSLASSTRQSLGPDAFPSSSTMASAKTTRKLTLKNVASTPVIRVTDSTTSLRSKALSQKIDDGSPMKSKALQENNDVNNTVVNENSTINKITKLDTRVVAPFMFQEKPPPRVITNALTNGKIDGDVENKAIFGVGDLNVEPKKKVEENEGVTESDETKDLENPQQKPFQASEESEDDRNEKQILDPSSPEDSQEEIQSDDSSSINQESFVLEKSLIQSSPSEEEKSNDVNILSTSVSSVKSTSRSETPESTTQSFATTTKSSKQAESQKPKSPSRTNAATKHPSAATPLKSALKSTTSSSSSPKSHASKSRRSTASSISSKNSSRTPSPVSSVSSSRSTTPVNNNKQETTSNKSSRAQNASNNNKTRASLSGNGVGTASGMRSKIRNNSSRSEIVAADASDVDSKGVKKKSSSVLRSSAKQVDSKDDKKRDDVNDKPFVRERSDSGFHGDDFDLVVPSASSYLEIVKKTDSKIENITNHKGKKSTSLESEKATGSKKVEKITTSSKGEKIAASKGEKVGGKISKDADVKSNKTKRSSIKEVKKIMGRIKSNSSLSSSSSESSRSSSKEKKVRILGTS